MTDFLDKTFPPNLKLAHKYEGLIYEALELLPKDSEPARKVALDFMSEFDDLLLGRLEQDSFHKSELLIKADTYMKTCPLDKFWGPGLTRLKQVRQDIWENINGA